MIKTVFEIGDSINNGRSATSIALAVCSEAGELAEEVRKIHCADFYKVPGKDGILGEGCDVLISVIDLLNKEGYTEEQILETVRSKANEWRNKA